MPKIDCAECGNACTVTNKSKEPLNFCPFCGTAVVLPFEEDEEDLIEDDEDEDADDED